VDQLRRLSSTVLCTSEQKRNGDLKTVLAALVDMPRRSFRIGSRELGVAWMAAGVYHASSRM
jgi:hypothetical protein